MKRPIARPTQTQSETTTPVRIPRAFAPDEAEIVETSFDPELEPDLVGPPPRRMGWIGRIAWTAGGILVSAGLALAADRLIRDLFARYEWLGWAGLGVLGAFVVALLALLAREIFALRRLRVLDALKTDAARARSDDDQKLARHVAERLGAIYADRPDMARSREVVKSNLPHLFDGNEIITLTERSLMAPLDARAKALTAASARRVALVTAVSPRALVDVAFVIYECAACRSHRGPLWRAPRLLRVLAAHRRGSGPSCRHRRSRAHRWYCRATGRPGTCGKTFRPPRRRCRQRAYDGPCGHRRHARRAPLPYETLPQPMVRDFIPELAKLGERTT